MGYTPLGKQGGDCSPHWFPEEWWHCELETNRYAIGGLENSSLYPRRQLDRHRSWSHVVYLVVSPLTAGKPARRKRLMVAFLSLELLVWLGPGDPEQVQALFDSLMGRELCADAGIFMLGSDDGMRSVLGRKRCVYSKASDMSTPELFPPGKYRKRVLDYGSRARSLSVG